MLISLYTSRVILGALGVTDYGIYNVVGGFVSMFALISAALTSACSRFLNFELGKGNPERQNVVFSTAVTIQCGLGIWKEDWNSITNKINDNIEIETYFVFFT